MSDENCNLIQCGKDGWSPWSIVCVHLVTGESREWVPIPSDNPEVDYDWACPTCESDLNEQGDNIDLNNLRAICIHCVRDLRKKYDLNFGE